MTPPSVVRGSPGLRSHGPMRHRVERLAVASLLVLGSTWVGAGAVALAAEETLENQLAEILARHEQGAAEAKDYGLVDDVLESRKTKEG